eukprot:863025-Prymnesium_polylepis.1
MGRRGLLSGDGAACGARAVRDAVKPQFVWDAALGLVATLEIYGRGSCLCAVAGRVGGGTDSRLS